ncbi:MAG: chorismate synthase [Bacteroidales bacterium]|nr:chorismate synthase [Bacteroidales bacterium]
MSGNTFGNIFRVTTFGESHGPALGGVIDGCPSGIKVDEAFIRQQLLRRQKGSKRKEPDEITWFSGLLDGVTTGTPLAFAVYNKDARPSDYRQEEFLLKPSHAHYAYKEKYGVFDYCGGGRASGRETVARVIAGSIAMQYLMKQNIFIQAYTLQIGDAQVRNFPYMDLSSAAENAFCCPQEEVYKAMQQILLQCENTGDTVGCKVGCVIKGVPAGLGEPVFGKLSARLAGAMMSIGAAKGFEYGAGMHAAASYGSQINDQYKTDFSTKHNFSGGISGGISTGEDIYFNVAFKPVPTLMQDMPTIDIKGNPAILKATGRHDVCISPKVLPVVESMAALCIIDSLLELKAYK